MLKRTGRGILFVLMFNAVCVAAQDADRYPGIRSIIIEAETASNGIPILPDRSKPLSTVADLYARAGYLQEAKRALSKAGGSAEQLSYARALYGDVDGAL